MFFLSLAARQNHQQENPPRVQDRRCGILGLCRTLNQPTQLRTVTRAHTIAWRKDMEARKLLPASIRRKLSGLVFAF
jgi:hypothetical protein